MRLKATLHGTMTVDCSCTPSRVLYHSDRFEEGVGQRGHQVRARMYCVSRKLLYNIRAKAVGAVLDARSCIFGTRILGDTDLTIDETVSWTFSKMGKLGIP